ncbi:hypothetical protein [Streptomyces sp. NPDC051211]|uniref:hypothetical protein n=1 Tax=Streptomyces sp. NPDC051211 TaxID=3154643 RepID=UPI00344C9A5F
MTLARAEAGHGQRARSLAAEAEQAVPGMNTGRDEQGAVQGTLARAWLLMGDLERARELALTTEDQRRQTFSLTFLADLADPPERRRFLAMAPARALEFDHVLRAVARLEPQALAAARLLAAG